MMSSKPLHRPRLRLAVRFGPQAGVNRSAFRWEAPENFRLLRAAPAHARLPTQKDTVMTVTQSSILRDPEILSGTACFSGTRVPVSTLMDYLKAGDRIDDFLEDFPTVNRDQVAAVLQIASEAVSDNARSA